jgi:hypothetical protein
MVRCLARTQQDLLMRTSTVISGRATQEEIEGDRGSEGERREREFGCDPIPGQAATAYGSQPHRHMQDGRGEYLIRLGEFHPNRCVDPPAKLYKAGCLCVGCEVHTLLTDEHLHECTRLAVCHLSAPTHENTMRPCFAYPVCPEHQSAASRM